VPALPITDHQSSTPEEPSEDQRRTVYLLSLGCAKNLVDAECMSQILSDDQFTIVFKPEDAEVLIVNTCGFIESAKKEAIQAILQMADLKQPKGRARFLIVTGCLAQRYAKEIRQDLPEVDAILGTAEYDQISRIIRRLYQDLVSKLDITCSTPPGSLTHLSVARRPSTPGRYAYIKIAEGCSNCCAYCAIPGIRGPLRSRPMQDIVTEADRLSHDGRDELVLIAQDTTRYGMDIYQKRMLVPLLKAICRLEKVRMVRILYVYADGLTDELIHLMANEPKIAHYLDLPIQHAADSVLIRMNRRDTQASLRQTISRLRAAMPDLILRTTVLVGFPGETDNEFTELLAFLQDMRFERLGCFAFSPEEGTPAYRMKPKVRKSIALQRQKIIMDLQKKITTSANRQRIGQVVEVSLESVDESGIFYIGRSYGEAPEVDPVIYVAGTTEYLSVGQTCPVRLIDAGDYDMTGVTEL